MYRVLVIDDEEMITDGLVEMLEGAERFELDVYKAYSGTEALRLLNEYQFDIVISDISMPGMTGIDVAEEIRNKWPMCRVIFQTGYDDFHYAKEAIRQKVFRYILKSEGDEALLEAIGECISSIEQDIEVQNTLLKMREEFSLYKSLLHRKFMMEVLTDASKEKEQRREIISRLEIDLDLERPLLLLAGKADRKMSDKIILSVDKALHMNVDYALNSEAVWGEGELIMWVLQPLEGENLRHTRAVVKGMAESLRGMIQQTLGMSISFIFCEKETDWNAAAHYLEELKQIALNRLNPDSQIAIAGMEYFTEEGTLTEAELEKSFVNRLMAYITEHLDGDLSLCSLSDKLHLNPSYLSRRFKELTGRTLTEVILELRMEKACGLLKTTSYRIGDVASMAGYETVANFSKVFKKKTGLTPKEYRDREGILR